MDLPLGQPQRLAITDEDTTPGSPTYGTLQDPSALELIVRPPSGSPTTYTYPGGDGSIVRAAQGSYYFDLTPEIPGQWSYRWIATGNFAGATDQLFFTVGSSSIG